jgi:hypothetical protein
MMKVGDLVAPRLGPLNGKVGTVREIRTDDTGKKVGVAVKFKGIRQPQLFKVTDLLRQSEIPDHINDPCVVAAESLQDEASVARVKKTIDNLIEFAQEARTKAVPTVNRERIHTRVGNPFLDAAKIPKDVGPVGGRHYAATVDLASYDPEFYATVRAYLELPKNAGGCGGQWDWPKGLIGPHGTRYGYDDDANSWRQGTHAKAVDYWQGRAGATDAWVQVAPTAGWPYTALVGYRGRFLELHGVMAHVEIPDPAPMMGRGQVFRHPLSTLTHSSSHTLPAADLWPVANYGPERNIESAREHNAKLSAIPFPGVEVAVDPTVPRGKVFVKTGGGKSYQFAVGDNADPLSEIAAPLVEMERIREEVMAALPELRGRIESVAEHADQRMTTIHEAECQQRYKIDERVKGEQYNQDIAITAVGQVMVELLEHLHHGYHQTIVGGVDYENWMGELRSAMTTLIDATDPNDAKRMTDPEPDDTSTERWKLQNHMQAYKEAFGWDTSQDRADEFQHVLWLIEDMIRITPVDNHKRNLEMIHGRLSAWFQRVVPSTNAPVDANKAPVGDANAKQAPWGVGDQ